MSYSLCEFVWYVAYKDELIMSLCTRISLPMGDYFILYFSNKTNRTTLLKTGTYELDCLIILFF